MKELSIKEKAKRYDEAIKKARNIVNSINVGLIGKNSFEAVFPELKESDDEKIRKALRERIIRYDPNNEILIKEEGISQRQFIDWIENQNKKTEPIAGFVSEFERQVSHLIASAINREHEYNKGYVKWAAQSLIEYAKREIEKQGEQKPAWSKEDEKMYIATIFALDQFMGNENKLDWLKSLKDRVQPQNGYNPYKEVVESIAEMCKHYDKATDLQDFYDNVKVKCKDAKEYDSLFPSQWKPSDEQITWLYRAADDASKDSRMKQILNELLSDLKKLMEE